MINYVFLVKLFAKSITSLILSKPVSASSQITIVFHLETLTKTCLKPANVDSGKSKEASKAGAQHC